MQDTLRNAFYKHSEGNMVSQPVDCFPKISECKTRDKIVTKIILIVQFHSCSDLVPDAELQFSCVFNFVEGF